MFILGNEFHISILTRLYIEIKDNNKLYLKQFLFKSKSFEQHIPTKLD